MMKEKKELSLIPRFAFCLLHCLVLLVTFSSSVAAQKSEVDLLVKRIEARYGPMRGLAAEFEQVFSGEGVRERRESGRLFLARPRRMRWEYPGKLLVVNGRDLWFYMVADREVIHGNVSSASDFRIPFLFLLGQTNLKRAFSSITMVEDEGNAETRALRLIPRTSAGGLREIFLYVTTDGRVMKVKLTSNSGEASEISLSNVRENYVAPAEAFQFTPPPGVTVRRQK